MIINIPNRENKQVRQLNKGKYLGDLWSSFNLDLQDELGVIKVSPRMKLADSSASEANMGLPCAFRHFDSRIFTIAGTRVFRSVDTNVINTTFNEDTSTGVKTTYNSGWSDMEVFNNALYTTTADELMKKVENGSGTGDYTEIDSAFANETSPHPLCYFFKYDRLYYADADFIASIDTSDAISSGSYEMDLGTLWKEVIVTMKATSNAIFIGTMSIATGSNSGKARGNVYEWDGFSGTVNKSYELDSAGVAAMCIKDDKPFIIDSDGILREFTGYSFREIGRLPYKNVLPYNCQSEDNDRFIHPNGFQVTKEGNFVVLVNNLLGDSAGSILENMPSGLWEWSPTSGFVHKDSFTYTSDTTITDYGQNRVSAVGALLLLDRYNTGATRNGQYICGATYYTDATTTASGVFYNDSNDVLQKFGYFVTTWLQTNQIKEIWQKIALRFRELLSATDKIIVKYRTRDDAPIYIDITWNDTVSFHTTTDISAYTGYEVEILQGVGSGKCFHIDSYSGSSPWKVNIDDTLVGATGTGKARLQNWKKVISETKQDVESNITTIEPMSERIQVKCCMQFTGDDTLHELSIISRTHENML